jgi:hypothetical protein
VHVVACVNGGALRRCFFHPPKQPSINQSTNQSPNIPKQNGLCRRADACPFAHGVFECWLHPSRYRTQLCTDGTACKRRVCFFAHCQSELRKPEEDPSWLQQQLADEAVSGAYARFGFLRGPGP